MGMQEIKVLVDEARLPEFYEMYGRWLAGKPADEVAESKVQLPWGSTDEDLALARVIWGKLSDRAKAMFSILMDKPETPFSAEYIAETVHIPNGKYGVAGVLAWPGRHSVAVGRKLPVSYEEGETPADGSVYWMTSEVAALFKKARDGDT
jgi:hypothetical protein